MTNFRNKIRFHAMGYMYNKNKKLGKNRGSKAFTIELINDELILKNESVYFDEYS
jgi:hypothetical protein